MPEAYRWLGHPNDAASAASIYDALTAAAGRIAKCVVHTAGTRRHLDMIADTANNHLVRDKAFDVSAELRQIFCRRCCPITLQCAIDDRLRKAGVESARMALCYQDQRIAS